MSEDVGFNPGIMSLLNVLCSSAQCGMLEMDDSNQHIIRPGCIKKECGTLSLNGKYVYSDRQITITLKNKEKSTFRSNPEDFLMFAVSERLIRDLVLFEHRRDIVGHHIVSDNLGLILAIRIENTGDTQADLFKADFSWKSTQSKFKISENTNTSPSLKFKDLSPTDEDYQYYCFFDDWDNFKTNLKENKNEIIFQWSDKVRSEFSLDPRGGKRDHLDLLFVMRLEKTTEA